MLHTLVTYWLRSAPPDSSRMLPQAKLVPERTSAVSKVVLGVRVSAYSFLVVILGVLGAFSFATLSAQELRKFREMNESASRQLEASLIAGLDAKVHTARAAARIFRYEPGKGSVFPQFSSISEELLQSSQMRALWLLAMVYPDERQAYESFLASNARELAGPELETLPSEKQQSVMKRYTSGLVNFDIVNEFSTSQPGEKNYVYSPAGLASRGTSSRPYYAVVTQGYPLVDSYEALGRDHHNDTVRQVAIDRAYTTGEVSCTDFTQLVYDVRRGIVRAISGLYAPIHNVRSDTGEQTVTGFTFLVFTWNALLRQSLPSFVRSFEIVVTSPGGTFTFDVGFSSAVDRGAGDLHDRATDAYKREFSIEVGGREFQFQTYPSRLLISEYITTRPRNISLVVTALTGCILALLLEIAHRRVTAQLATAAAVESAKTEMENELAVARHVFVSSVSHEIRTPASAIIGALDVLKDSKLTKTQREMCSIISTGSSEILNLVEDALSVGLGGDAQFKINASVANLRKEFLHRAWQTARLQKRFADKIAQVKMELHIHDAVPTHAEIDAGRACQVVTNLVGNAIKFEKEGGTITCSVDVCTDSDGVVDGLPPRQLLRVVVRDTGLGLSEEQIGRLFRPFSQADGAETKRRFGGTGLGLVISRELCMSMGGDLTVASEGPGLGSEFTATFELIDARIARSSTHCASEAGGYAPSHASTGGHGAAARRASHLESQSSGGSATFSHLLGRTLGRDKLSSEDAVGGGLQPVTEEASEPAPRAARSSVAFVWQPRVCFAEDDPLLRRVTSMSLRMAHFTCEAFEDGAKASAAIEADPSRFHLVCLDGSMGGGEKDGLPTLRRIQEFFDRRTAAAAEAAARAAFSEEGEGADGDAPPAPKPLPAPPVVILTGETDPEVHSGFLEAGAVRVVVKPVKLEQLKALHELVSRETSCSVAGWLHGHGSDAGGSVHDEWMAATSGRKRSVSSIRTASEPQSRRGSSTLSEW